jgi:hypothetical protein
MASRSDQLHDKVDKLIDQQNRIEKKVDLIANMLDNIDIKVQGSMVILSDLNDDMINRR